MRLPVTLVALALTLCFTGTQAMALSDEDVLGVWQDPDSGSHIKIYQCGKSACAKVVKVKDPTRKDIHNPNPALRNRPVVGVVLLKGGKKVGPQKWEGKLYNTRDGNTYHGTLTLLSKKQLKLTGCILGGLICMGPTWDKVK